MPSNTFIENITSTISNLMKSATNISKDPNIWTKLFNILFKSIIAIALAILVCYNLASSSFIGKKLVLYITSVFIIWNISSYSRGQWEDHIVTFIILNIIFGIYYGSWINIKDIFGLGLSSPITIGYFVILSWFSLILIISRFTYLNIVKATGWMIGLTTICLFIFTYSVLGTLEICLEDNSSKGLKDPFIIVLMSYVTWIVLLGLTLYAELRNNNKIFKFCIVIGIIFVGYILKRCDPAIKKMKNANEKDAETIAIKDEPSWINTSAHIATVLSWFNLFIRHYKSSALFAGIGYFILDNCAPKDDPRILSVNIVALLNFFIGICYNLKKYI